MQETADQKNSEYGHFSCNDLFHNSETVFLLQKSWSQNFYFHFAMRPGKKLKVDFHDEGPYQIESSSLICSVNQCTGFYMIRRD